MSAHIFVCDHKSSDLKNPNQVKGFKKNSVKKLPIRREQLKFFYFQDQRFLSVLCSRP